MSSDSLTTPQPSAVTDFIEVKSARYLGGLLVAEVWGRRGSLAGPFPWSVLQLVVTILHVLKTRVPVTSVCDAFALLSASNPVASPDSLSFLNRRIGLYGSICGQSGCDGN